MGAMKGMLSVIAMALVSALFVGTDVASQAKGPGKSLDPLVSAFAVRGIPASTALLKLSKTGNVPIGIVVQGEELCSTQVSYSAENSPASVIASGIAAQVPGYAASGAGSSLIVIGPISPAPVTSKFLGLIDKRYAVKGNLQTLATMLWVHILAILRPDQGSAGSILGSTNDRVFGVELTDASVEQILDRIATETNGTWILRPLPPKLDDLEGEAPFEIFSEFGKFGSDSRDLCSPVGAAGPK
jgi:hypothetical protein